MDQSAKSPTVIQRVLPRFGMATGLKVVTGCCILCSLITWDPVLGGMLCSLIFGTWWSFAAVRAGRRRLAYYLAVWPMGVVAFSVGVLPIMGDVSQTLEMPGEMLFTALAIICLAWLVTTLILGAWIRDPSVVVSVVAGVLSVYLTAAMSCLIAYCYALIVSFAFAQSRLFMMVLLPALPAGLVFSVVWATKLMPVAGPVAVCFCVILRRIDPD